MKPEELKQWAWGYAASLVSADVNAGYIQYRDEGVDPVLGMQAFQEVIREMKEKSNTTPPTIDKEGRSETRHSKI